MPGIYFYVHLYKIYELFKKILSFRFKRGGNSGFMGCQEAMAHQFIKNKLINITNYKIKYCVTTVIQFI